MPDVASPVVPVERLIRSGDAATSRIRTIPEETPIVRTYGRSTFAVMMETPADLWDFALGVSLCVGIVECPEETKALDIVALPDGIESRMDAAPGR
jgi:FdhD protein